MFQYVFVLTDDILIHHYQTQHMNVKPGKSNMDLDFPGQTVLFLYIHFVITIQVWQFLTQILNYLRSLKVSVQRVVALGSHFAHYAISLILMMHFFYY